LQMAAFTGNGEWRDIAERMLGEIQESAVRYPTAFAQWLSAIDFALAPVQEVAILVPSSNSGTSKFTDILWKRFRPHLVTAMAKYPPLPGAPELLQDRTLVNGQTTVYVCRQFVCQQPVTEAQAMENLLE
jgi:uncharacterized protein YyaL (SSP411 family)